MVRSKRLIQFKLRRRMIEEVRGHLEATDYPRLQLLAVVTAAAATGFATSVGLLNAGLDTMAVRYGLSAILGYVAFLVGLRLWLRWQRRRALSHLSSRWRDLFDASIPDLPSPSAEIAPDFAFGGSGEFGGGGAGTNLDAIEQGALTEVVSAGAETSESASGALELLGGAADVDEGAVIVVPLIAAGFLVAGLIAAIVVVLGAPTLLAELFLDGVIASIAYRRLRNVPARSWLTGALQRTWKPAVALTISLVLVGLAAKWLAPEANSIGDLWR